MTSSDLRRGFLEFFKSRGHAVLPSSRLVPDDRTLLFTSAGMVQFKDVFWGKVPPPTARVTTCQKCFRTTDIERVGTTAYHHTFFEMLGNFSFGDYFKEGAITWAWEFLTSELGLPQDRLWISVYEEDEEAYNIWRDQVGVPAQRIVRLGKDNNWWGPVGDSGPCGPDSEIYWDWGRPACGPTCKPGCDCGRWSEVWNLVFMQYEAQPDGTLRPLAKKNIDTGMGLERMTAVLQGVYSNFETDLFRPIVDQIEALAKNKDLAARNLLADHLRAAVFVISDGVLPDSEDSRGSVLRKVFMRLFLGAERLELPTSRVVDLVDPVVDALGPTYPEIQERRNLVQKVILAEGETFRRRRETFRRLVEDLPKDLQELPGELVFKWYDTHGIPKDFIEALAKDMGLNVDWPGFERELEVQKTRSRSSVSVAVEAGGGSEKVVSTQFVGYSELECDSPLEAIWDEKEKPVDKVGPGEWKFAFSRTPFYAEGGGQIADAGWIENLSRLGRAEVRDVQRSPQGTLHEVHVLEGEFRVGDRCRLRVDEARRKGIERAHTATHLIHAALRTALGPHVVQAGSWVGPEEFRFDFTHFAPLGPEELGRVEELAFAGVLEDRPVQVEELPLEEAKARGALAHFEEEYTGKDRVRVVSVPGISMELCGGTHARRTGEIGLVVVVAEESVAAGTRRLRVLVGEKARRFYATVRADRRQAAQALEAPEGEVVESVHKLVQEARDLRLSLRKLQDQLASYKALDLLGRAQEVDGVKLLGAVVEGEAEELKRLADTLAERLGRGAVVLGSNQGGRGLLVAKVVNEPRLSAGDLVRLGAEVLGGKGGGRPAFAQGGGPHGDKVSDAVARAIREAQRQLGR